MATAEYSGAEWIPDNHYWTGRQGHRASWIIIHGTAGGGSAAEVAGWFVNNNPPTSVHYVVGRDGTVVQCVREQNSAWGNGVVSTGHDSWWSPNLNPNLETISIEHVKPDSNNASGLTEAQQAASFRLIGYLCKKWGIPARAADAAGGITGHYSIDPVNRSFCPGTYPWSALWTYLKSDSVGVPGSGGGGNGGGTSTYADQLSNPLDPAGEVINFIESLFIKTHAIQRAPVSGGILGVVEGLDEVATVPAFDSSNMIGWGLAALEAGFIRTCVVILGFLIVLVALWNITAPMREAAEDASGPLLSAVASGAI